MQEQYSSRLTWILLCRKSFAIMEISKLWITQAQKSNLWPLCFTHRFDKLFFVLPNSGSAPIVFGIWKLFCSFVCFQTTMVCCYFSPWHCSSAVRPAHLILDRAGARPSSEPLFRVPVCVSFFRYRWVSYFDVILSQIFLAHSTTLHQCKLVKSSGVRLDPT